MVIDIRDNKKIDLTFKNYKDILKNGKVIPQRGISNFKNVVDNFYQESRFYKIDSIGYDEDFPRKEGFENVLSSIHNPQQYNFVYMISGTKKGVDIYLGVVKNFSGDSSTLDAEDYGEILKSSISGNFQGTTFAKREGDSESYNLSRDQIDKEILNPILNSKRASFLTGFPTLNKNNENGDSKENYQGMDRLINGMLGSVWQIFVVCEPIKTDEAVVLKENIYNIYDGLYAGSKKNFQENSGKSENHSKTEGKSKSVTKGKSEGESISKGTNHSKNDNTTEGSSKGESRGSSHSTNSSLSKSFAKGSSVGTSTTKGSSENRSYSEQESENSSKNRGFATSKGTTENFEFINKKYQNIMKYIDDFLLERIDLGKNKGFFKTSIYSFAENLSTLKRLENNIISIFQGYEQNFNPINFFELENFTFSNLSKKDINKALIMGQIFDLNNAHFNIFSASILGIPADINRNRVTLATYMTIKELSIFLSFPTKEVPGLSLKEGIDFGLNIPKIENGIDIGYILNRGYHLKDNRVLIDKDIINKHIFMAGVTGSGKTTTAQKILIESKLPFMVIEPAKTEYRVLLKDQTVKDDIEIYSLGNEKITPFRFNPFELQRGELITSHIDMLKASFTAAFPMEAAMPYIIEEAIYKIYEDYGWSIDDNENIKCDDPWESGDYWPLFSDMIESLKYVIKSKGFGPELESNYIGALVSRFSNLTIGSKGRMLNCKRSIDIERLLNKKVIIELEELKDPREKALMMGFILGRIGEAVKIKHNKDSNFKHITLIEEAHRLLSKPDFGDDGSKKMGVTVFSDMLAEVRKYGESFIIIDQIPNKLTPEVLKNTNTKIIHRLFAKDDKQTVGNTMALDEKQERYLSLMEVGEVVIFSQNWNKAVNVKIEQTTDTSSKVLTGNDLKNIGIKQKQLQKEIYYPEFSDYIDNFTIDEMSRYQKIKKKMFKNLKNLKSYKDIDKNYVENIKNLILKLKISNMENLFEVFYKDVIKKLEKNKELKNGNDIWKDNIKTFLKNLFFEQKIDQILSIDRDFGKNIEYFNNL